MVIRNITVTCRLKRNTVNYEQEEQGKTVKPTNSTPNLNMGRDTYLIWSGSEQYQSSNQNTQGGMPILTLSREFMFIIGGVFDRFLCDDTKHDFNGSLTESIQWEDSLV